MSTSSFFDEQHTSDHLPLPWWFRALRRWEVQRVDVAAKMLPSGQALLDLGCGDGELVARVADKFPRVVATDVSAAALKQARERNLASHVQWVEVDGNAVLPFADNSFDTVVSLSTLQYIVDPERFLREVHRVLTPAGHLLLEVPNVAYLPQRLRLLAGRPIRTSYWRHGIDGGNLHYFTLDSLVELLSQAGFRKLQHSASGVFAPLRTWRATLLCGNLFVLAQRD